MTNPLIKTSLLDTGARLAPRSAHATIESYTPVDPVSAHYKQQFLNLIAAHPDTFANRYNYELGVHGHLTAQAYVFNPTLRAIGLMHHKKLGLWVGFGGHVEQGDTDLMATALREAREESGLKNLTLHSPVPIDLDIHGFPAKGDQPDHLHYDARFLFTTDETEFAPNNESTAIEWVPLADLPARTGMWLPNSRLIRYAQAHLG